MRRFIIFLILLIISVWIGLKIAEDPGYALFSYKNWSVTMPLWFAVVAFLGVLFLFYFTIRMLDGLGFSMYRLRNWMRWRRKNKSYNKTSHGLIELIEAHWRGAEYYLLEGMKRSNMPLVNYLAAAKAAHEQGAFDRRDNYLQRAHDVAPQADVAIGLVQAQLLLKQGQLEQALATLKPLYAKAPRHQQVLKLLERVYVHLADWNGLLKIVPSLRKANVISHENLEKLEGHIYQQQLQMLANKPDANVLAQAQWRKIPRKFHKDPVVIASFVEVTAKDNPEEVAQLIQQTMKKSYQKELVIVYGDINVDAKKQLAFAESWLKKYGPQADLLRTLGKLCMRCQLWGKAKQYFEESLHLESNPKTYAAQGELLERLGDMPLALQSYREGLVTGE